MRKLAISIWITLSGEKVAINALAHRTHQTKAAEIKTMAYMEEREKITISG
jgi:hypothetical protein